MRRLEKILFATDFSPCARQAWPHAVSLARALGAKVHVLHVVIPHSLRVGEPDVSPPDPEEARRRVEAWAKDEMAGLVAEMGAPATEVEKAVRHDAQPAPAILDHAEEVRADLIVLGTHGRRGPGRLIFGSVAEEVVRRATCPVLTVRERELGARSPGVRRILVPLDFSDASLAALGRAKELASGLGARLDLLHVVDQVVLPAFYVPGAPGVYPHDVRSLLTSAQEELRRAMAAAGGPDVPFEAHTFSATPAFGIVEQAESLDADLIVLSTRGLTGLERLLLGSTAERVVRMAPCPVLTVGAKAPA